MSRHALVQISGRTDAPAARPSWQQRLARLRELLRELGSVVVAYSGGVDSSLLLRVAHEVLGARALGVIGRSDSYAGRELALALEQARRFGARVEVVPTGELSDPRFRSNPAHRCYHCKSELYRRLAEAAARGGGRARGALAARRAGIHQARRARGGGKLRAREPRQARLTLPRLAHSVWNGDHEGEAENGRRGR